MSPTTAILILLLAPLHSALSLPTSPATFSLSPVPDLGATPSSSFSAAADCIFTAFSGAACDRAAGEAVRVRTFTCVKTDDRHSFRLSAGCARTQMQLFAREKCLSIRPTVMMVGAGCWKVDTGENWRTARIIVKPARGEVEG